MKLKVSYLGKVRLSLYNANFIFYLTHIDSIPVILGYYIMLDGHVSRHLRVKDVKGFDFLRGAPRIDIDSDHIELADHEITEIHRIISSSPLTEYLVHVNEFIDKYRGQSGES